VTQQLGKYVMSLMLTQYTISELDLFTCSFAGFTMANSVSTS